MNKDKCKVCNTELEAPNANYDEWHCCNCITNPHRKEINEITTEYGTISKYWVCKVDEIQIVTELHDSYNDGTVRGIASLNCEPERFFLQKASAVKWIAENQGEWTIVEVFTTSKTEIEQF